MDTNDGEVTRTLKAMHEGDAKAAERLLPLLYEELHRLAKSYMRGERPDHTLQATALINEAYLRLVGERVQWNSRAHFVGVAAQAMRRVLVDHARANKAERRAGKLKRVELQDNIAVSPGRLEEVEAIDAALKRLAVLKPRQAQVVELRYFGGLSIDEIASLLGLASRSVKRDWSLARIWLYRDLQNGKESYQKVEKDNLD